MKWPNACKVFKTNSLEPDAASHNNASWYMDTDGFPEHSPIKGSLDYKGLSLQKIILLFGGVSLVYQQMLYNNSNSRLFTIDLATPSSNILSYIQQLKVKFKTSGLNTFSLGKIFL